MAFRDRVDAGRQVRYTLGHLRDGDVLAWGESVVGTVAGAECRNRNWESGRSGRTARARLLVRTGGPRRSPLPEASAGMQGCRRAEVGDG
jgi:hypothetical protein